MFKKLEILVFANCFLFFIDYSEKNLYKSKYQYIT